jgi:hypothetical protein
MALLQPSPHGGPLPRRRLRRRAVAGAVAASAILAVGGLLAAPHLTTTAVSAGCTFLSSPGAVPAFCDTFDLPAGTGTRAGDLNGTVWGVSHVTSQDNPSQGQLYPWAAAGLNACGTSRVVQPPHDVAVCNGQVVEAVNDNEGQTVLAMYPKQPFDFAGRTGTVVFDVGDNTQGTHAAWPAFVLSDQPVPAPYGSAPGISDSARSSVGFSIAGACGQWGCGGSNNPPGAGQPGFTCISVDSMFTTSNYQYRSVPFRSDGCIRPSTAVGSNNHVEVQINSAGIRVFASDPGSPSDTRLIADASFAVPLSRGLVWMEDVHYNANKFNTQQTDTFSWDNLGFDGPVLPRDLAFDVLDNAAPGVAAQNGLPTANLGYNIQGSDLGSRPLGLTVANVSHLANASAALVLLNYWPTSPQSLTYSVNGHAAHQFAWPFGSQPTYVSQTVAMPVPLSELQSGSNGIQINTSDHGGVDVANVGLVLVGAGGPPGGATPAPSTTAAPAPTPTPGPSPMPIGNVPCTVVLQGASRTGLCSGTFAPS